LIKLILFDINGVFLTLEDDPFVEKFAKKYGLTKVEFQDVYDRFTISAEYDNISSEKAWQDLLDYFHIRENARSAFESAMKLKKVIPGMFELLAKVKEKRKVAYLTNYYPLAWEYCNKKWDLEEKFDGGIVSFQVKARKPEEKGFKIILQQFNLKPEEILFIDDGLKNVKAAQLLGMQAIHFQNKQQLEKQLKKLRVIA